MAKSGHNPKSPQEAGKPQPRFVPFVLMVVLGLALFSWQFAVFALIGLLPTFVLSYTGVGPWKFEKVQCVGLCNLATVVIFALPLWNAPESFNGFITNPLMIAGAFSGAAMGYVLIFIGPIIAAIILQGLSQERTSRLMKQRKDLIEEWGGELVGGSNTPEN